MATVLEVTGPRLAIAEFEIVGDTPYVQARFAVKAEEFFSSSRKRKTKDPADDPSSPEVQKQRMKKAQHLDAERGWPGIPCAAIRNAMISACRTVGVKMTQAKLAVHALPDGLDQDGQPIIRMIGDPEPELFAAHTRNSNGGMDLRFRPMWRKWRAVVRIQYDETMLSEQSVANLLLRAGQQVGIGEGRPDSRMSGGMGFGLFRIKGE